MAHRFKVCTEGPYPHFITVAVVRWFPVFISGDYFQIVLDSLEYLRRERGLAIHAYVIMPTHFHAVVTALGNDLSAIMRDFKKFTAGQIFAQATADNNRLLTWFLERAAQGDERSRFKVWQDEFHPEVIYSQAFCQQKVDYLHDNPVRKGLAQMPSQWYQSSAGVWYGDGTSPIEIDALEW